MSDRLTPAPAPAPAPAAAFAGVDVAKHSLRVCVLSEAGARRHDADVPYDDAGLAALAADLRARGVRLVVLEATGGYERRLVSALHAAGGPDVVVANPAQVRDFAKGLGRRAKNDPIDAHVIARFAQLLRPDPRPLPSAEQRLLDARAARRRQLVGMRTAELNRRQQADAADDEAVGRTFEKVLAALGRQLAALDAEIAAQVAAHPQWRRTAEVLASVPGVGPATARALVAELPELGTLNRRQVAALAGLAPYDHDSGKLKGKRCIAGGRGVVRSALYMAMLTASRFNPAIRPMYRRLSADRGKPKMVAMVACMRKLLTILNAMVKADAVWDPARFAGGTA